MCFFFVFVLVCNNRPDEDNCGYRVYNGSLYFNIWNSYDRTFFNNAEDNIAAAEARWIGWYGSLQAGPFNWDCFSTWGWDYMDCVDNGQEYAPLASDVELHGYKSCGVNPSGDAILIITIVSSVVGSCCICCCLYCLCKRKKGYRKLKQKLTNLRIRIRRGRGSGGKGEFDILRKEAVTPMEDMTTTIDANTEELNDQNNSSGSDENNEAQANGDVDNVKV